MVATKIFYCFLALISIFFLNACSNNEFKTLNSKYNYIFDYDGFKKTLKIQNSNHAYALFFLTQDCGACDAQIPILNELYKERKFLILAVLNGVKLKEDAQKILLEKKLDLPLIYEAKASSFLSKAVGGIYGVPVIVFFDEKGNRYEKFIGLTPKSILENKTKFLQ
ncbi:TlpA family protein disulfide reductase [Campylobacter subantarcticus]|uniref:Protein disulfide reductase, TlpA family n=1 Tax=Campylobacter subantarcticus LMG 24374 TaxID=1388751 RepID=A0A0A8HE28_9BACT|nr:protein disulfide reductase, TlpA family [Campylobacter subantarcticus]AJC91169.1 protein disulfide reductase, TlpA family [Campylobacter subantarcticus LMG 24374]EAJ1261451.1 protein disulfide reductase, TlpA family [Campylobacter lari]